jgi:hypothetical protein
MATNILLAILAVWVILQTVRGGLASRILGK